jgi:hypothetical protein
MLSETSKSPLKTAERSEEYNIPSDQEKAQNRLNFITLGRILEQNSKRISISIGRENIFEELL